MLDTAFGAFSALLQAILFRATPPDNAKPPALARPAVIFGYS